MTATAANARLLGCTEGPSDAWRTALALRADAQQSRPSAKSYPFAACRLGLEWAVLSSLAWVRLMRRCKSGGDGRLEWLIGPLGRRRHVSDVLCPAKSMIPARGAEGLWLSSSSSTPLVDVFISLLWSETNARSDQ